MTGSLKTRLQPAHLPLKPASHVDGLDFARVIACLGVIWFHSGSPYHVLGYFRNPFFTVLLTFLVTDGMFHPSRHGFREFVALRSLRILVPFAIWMTLYRIPNLLAGHLVVPLSWDHLGIGLGATHLWFLPFAFCVSIIAYGLARAVMRLPARVVPMAAGLLLAVGLVSSFLPLNALVAGETWDRWASVLACVAIGPAVGFLYQSNGFRRGIKAIWPLWPVAWLACAGLSMNASYTGFGACSGLCLVLAGLSVPLPNWPAVWRKAGSLAYGAYLTHLAFFIGMVRLGFQGDRIGLVRFGIMVAGAFLASELLQRVAIGRLAVGMRISRTVRAPAFATAATYPLKSAGPVPVVEEAVSSAA